MADYKKMYTKLFNAVTDSINILQKAQVETEEMFVDHDPTPIKIVKPKGDDDKEGGDDA